MFSESEITAILNQSHPHKLEPSPSCISDILNKALELKGLSLTDAAILSNVTDPDQLQEIFAAAKKVKESIYGNRLVIFAPLYISNICSNDCAYCAFRTGNHAIKRCSLSQDDIYAETETLIAQGHKRILLLAGESNAQNYLQYILDSIATIYRAKKANGEIRRLNVEIAPLTTDEFKLLKQANIGTYILFQETYHRETYKKMHPHGPKSDYDWRLTAMDRAMSAKIDDVGIGVLFGLADWRFELLALLKHAEHLNNKFGVGPHTISVPRLEPAVGSAIAAAPPYPVSDENFCKIIAILRLAVPYTGIIMSTRETPQIRRKTFALGVSQISAGSRTNPGGYNQEESKNTAQFSLGDHRTLDDVIYDITKLGYIPSFCTACYRLGRTGEHFMHLAKPGTIKNMCLPNALLTFQEYLIDFAEENTRIAGEQLIKTEIAKLPETLQQTTKSLLAKIKSGKRDAFV
jgi:2-iminoacetate synthase